MLKHYKSQSVSEIFDPSPPKINLNDPIKSNAIALRGYKNVFSIQGHSSPALSHVYQQM